MGGMTQGENGPVANVFTFTVKDPAVIPQIQAAATSNRPVKLVYIQWFVSPIGMDTDYEIVGVKPAG